MLSKEECKRALENMRVPIDVETEWYSVDILNEVIDEHFKLKEKYSKILDDVHDYKYETHCMKMIVRNLCEHFGVENEKELQNIYLNRPYKFEDLHDFMAYHDKVLNKDCLIAQVCDKENISICWYEEENMLTEDWVEFEESRFYPTQMANNHGNKRGKMVKAIK